MIVKGRHLPPLSYFKGMHFLRLSDPHPVRLRNPATRRALRRRLTPGRFSRWLLRAIIPLVALAAGLTAFRPAGPRETVYCVVLFNRSAVVGASSTESGVFYSTNSGATWGHMGWENIRAFNV